MDVFVIPSADDRDDKHDRDDRHDRESFVGRCEDEVDLVGGCQI